MESGQALLALKCALCLLTTTRRGCVPVLTNKILNRILAITRVIALVPGHIVGYVVASLTFIPFALSIYVSIMFLIWLPLAGLMLVTSWLLIAQPLRRQLQLNK